MCGFYSMGLIDARVPLHPTKPLEAKLLVRPLRLFLGRACAARPSSAELIGPGPTTRGIGGSPFLASKKTTSRQLVLKEGGPKQGRPGMFKNHTNRWPERDDPWPAREDSASIF